MSCAFYIAWPPPLYTLNFICSPQYCLQCYSPLHQMLPTICSPIIHSNITHFAACAPNVTPFHIICFSCYVLWTYDALSNLPYCSMCCTLFIICWILCTSHITCSHIINIHTTPSPSRYFPHHLPHYTLLPMYCTLHFPYCPAKYTLIIFLPTSNKILWVANRTLPTCDQTLQASNKPLLHHMLEEDNRDADGCSCPPAPQKASCF
jgi:hypothetical protein